jgi:nucleoside-diphosphate-sugar epimerase
MIEIFGGTGFVGSEFYKKYSHESKVVSRNQLEVPNDSTILYLISTVDNYNVLEDPKLDIKTNLLHLIDVLEANKNNNVTFHFVSSWFVYGDCELPANERSSCRPKGFYSITKLAAEQLLESYCKTFNIKYTITRLANVVGKTDGKISKKKNALQYLISKLKNNEHIDLYYDGIFLRDFIHVSDVADGLRYIVDHGKNGEIYNLGSGSAPIIFKDVIEYAKKSLESTSTIGSMDPTEFHKIVQVKDMYLDTSKLNNLGWKPSMTVFQAINTLL